MISEAVRRNGYCGEVSADGEFVCIKDAGHADAHGDERWNEEASVTTTKVRVEWLRLEFNRMIDGDAERLRVVGSEGRKILDG
jgi:hypothetical protein